MASSGPSGEAGEGEPERTRYPEQWGREGLIEGVVMAFFLSYEEFGLVRQEDVLWAESPGLAAALKAQETAKSLEEEGRLEVGAPAAAADETGNWRRMRVTELIRSPKGRLKVKLACVDTYKELVMKPELVKPLPAALLQHPPCLFHCRLSREQQQAGPAEVPDAKRMTALQRPELFLLSAIPVDDPAAPKASPTSHFTTVLLQFPVDFDRQLRLATKPRHEGDVDAGPSGSSASQGQLSFYTPKMLKLQGKLNSATWMDYQVMRVVEVTATSGVMTPVDEGSRAREQLVKRMGTDKVSLTATTAQLHGGSLTVGELSRIVRVGDVFSVKSHRYVIPNHESEDLSTMSAWEARDMRSRNMDVRHPLHAHAVLQELVTLPDGREVAKLVSRVFEGLVIGADSEAFGLDCPISHLVCKYRTVVVRAWNVKTKPDMKTTAAAVGGEWAAEAVELLEPLEEDIGYLYMVAPSFSIIYRDRENKEGEALPCRYIFAPTGLILPQGLAQSDWHGRSVRFAACMDQPGASEAAKAANGKWKAVQCALLPDRSRKRAVFPGIWAPTGGDRPVHTSAASLSRSASASKPFNADVDDDALQEWQQQTTPEVPVGRPSPPPTPGPPSSTSGVPSGGPRPLGLGDAPKDGFYLSASTRSLYASTATTIRLGPNHWPDSPSQSRSSLAASGPTSPPPLTSGPTSPTPAPSGPTSPTASASSTPSSQLRANIEETLRGEEAGEGGNLLDAPLMPSTGPDLLAPAPAPAAQANVPNLVTVHQDLIDLLL